MKALLNPLTKLPMMEQTVAESSRWLQLNRNILQTRPGDIVPAAVVRRRKKESMRQGNGLFQASLGQSLGEGLHEAFHGNSYGRSIEAPADQILPKGEVKVWKNQRKINFWISIKQNLKT
jgi:hypothetical protein